MVKDTAISIRVSSDQLAVLDAFLFDYKPRGIAFSRSDMLWTGVMQLMQDYDAKHGSDWYGEWLTVTEANNR